ncbi:MAG: glycosyltransferase [Desulfobacterales bacterium]|nr:glycosyltransferase [Desulfobacterales bacterium]
MRFKPTDDTEKIRQALKLPDSKIILFTVRNLVARMGLENLIKAVQLVVRNAADIYLVIGGAGPLRDQLARMAEQLGVNDCIRFEGFIPEESLPNYYQMADMFILPTKELEGFGLVTLEAMASGVPVLGTPVGGTKEIISRFDSSFMFNTDFRTGFNRQFL